MNENLRKMEESKQNYMSLKWFNSQLFTINGTPLKFHLDGYSVIEIYEMVKIIEAYGGELSKPDAPDTFVFCEPGRPVRAQKWDRYDIQYFHDSVIALQPQELVNYKLQVFTKQPPVSSVNADESSNLWIKVENLDESQESMDYKLQVSTDDNSTSFVDKSCSSDPEQPNESTEENSCARTQPRPYIRATKSFSSDADRLDENKIAVTTENVKNNEDYDENSSEDNEDSDDSEVSDSSQSEEEEFIPSSHRRSSTAGANKTPRRSKVIFTEEENQTMIDWVIKRGVIPSDTGRKIWKEFLKEKILPNGNLTVFRLRRHFRVVLKNHPTFQKFIEDTRSSGRSLSYGSTTVYTEEEKRILIKYLVDKNVIHRARNPSVWNECLRECKESLNPCRTGTNLAGYFRQRLCHDYAKYTDDPRALRQFEKMEKGRKNRRRE